MYKRTGVSPFFPGPGASMVLNPVRYGYFGRGQVEGFPKLGRVEVCSRTLPRNGRKETRIEISNQKSDGFDGF